MIKSQFLIAVALLIGVAVGYCVRDDGGSAAPKPDAAKAPRAAIADQGASASVGALRRRIAELEAQLVRQKAESETVVSNAVAEAVKVAEERRPRGNPREWLENLRKTDPARYTQMTNRFAQWKRRRQERARNTQEFLSSIDTSHMSAAAKKTHDALQELISRREELEEQLHQENITDDARRGLMDQMREISHEMRRLNSEERVNLIGEVARNLGFEGEDSQAFVSTVQEVVEATGGDRGGFGPPPDGGQPPAGGPPPSGGGPGGR